MFEYIEGFVKVNGINLHYYRTGGNKSKFILLHGAMDNGLCWTPVAEMLSEKYDVIMLDAQGHGLSDRLDPDFTSMNHTHQVVGLTKELDISSPIIMGHSMGASTTANIAADYPDLPKAIILEDPGWNIPGLMGPGDEEERAKQREAFMKSFMEYGKRNREDLIAECRETNPRWPEADIVAWAESKLLFDPTIFSRMRPDRPSYTEVVPKITCPALLITSDAGIVAAVIAEKAVSLSKAELPLQWVEIKGAGHNIRRDQFRIFCDTLNKFLDGLSEHTD